MKTEGQKKSDKRYKEKNIHRIGLDVQNKFFYEELKPEVERQGETVNGYIKKAIIQRMERERK